MTRPQQMSNPALAKRLRELRERHWEGHPVTQKSLSEAFGLRESSISNYESPDRRSAVSERRLRDYATYFATRRSLKDGRLLSDDEMSDEELSAREALLSELLALQNSGEAEDANEERATADALWTFAPGESVRIICGELSDMGHPWSDPTDPNYTALLRYADSDALIELFGHVRKCNPHCDVRFMFAGELSKADDIASHLVVLGGLSLNRRTTRLIELSDLPIRQVKHPDLANGEVFDVGDGSEPAQPGFLKARRLELTEDVGLFARLSNPYNRHRTLTVCSGIYSRGVLGAVRMLTDAELAPQNAAYLADEFGAVQQFAVLMRVHVLLGEVLTPDLQDDEVRLFAWSGATAAAES